MIYPASNHWLKAMDAEKLGRRGRVVYEARLEVQAGSPPRLVGSVLDRITDALTS
jgi:hypothetical protein